MLFTVNQVKNGVGVGWNSLKVDDLALKSEVPTKEDFTELQNTVGGKLDKSPAHTHEISQITQLSNTLATKLDNTKKYNYSSLLSNPEAIDYLTKLQTTNVEIVPKQNENGYKFDVDTVGDLRIISNSQVIAHYDSTNKKWYLGTNDIVGILANHAEAINKISGGGVSSHTHELKDITDYDTSIASTLANFKVELLKAVYPIGSIYTSTDSTEPSTLFGFGTWEQITDSFLYCTTSGGETGGSKTISIDNLPAHSHQAPIGWGAGKNGEGYARCDQNSPATLWGPTTSVGSGKDYMPPYYTVFAWKRTA